MPYKDRNKKRENNRKWYKNNRSKRLVSLKAWNDANSDKRKNDYATKSANKVKPVKSVLTKEEKLQKARDYEREKYASDVNYKLARRLRCRLKEALKGGYKSGSAISLLGCSISDFKAYIESLFLKGMSWDNYGQYGWHVDHKKPLSSFDLQDPEQLKEACHYTNLQPLWWRDNLCKQDKILNAA